MDQAYRGKGVGSRLVKACIELCPSLGIDNLLGFVFSHNSASLALLKKQGFQTWGELPAIAEMDGQLYGLTILGLKLTTAS